MTTTPFIYWKGDALYFSFVADPPVGFRILVDYKAMGDLTLFLFCEQWSSVNKNRFVEACDGLLTAEAILERIKIDGYYRFDPTLTRLQ